MYSPKIFVCLLLFSIFVPASAQESSAYVVPRTEYGHPDLQGNWLTGASTPLERPDDIHELILNQAQAQKLAAAIVALNPEVDDPDVDLVGSTELAVVKGEYRSSVIIQPANGKIPFSAAGLALSNQILTSHMHKFDHPEQRPPAERCLGGAGNPPMRLFPFAVPYQIVQNQDYLMIYPEDPSGVRIINIKNGTQPQALRSVNGFSVGNWQGDTLNIQTTHFSGIDPSRENFGRLVLIGENSRVLERITRLNATELLYQFTVEDSAYYTEPWSGEYSFTRLDGNVYEYSCHEGNYSLPGILRGGQMQSASAP